MGILLFQAASAAEQAQQVGDQDALMQVLTKLKVFFTINGILAIIGIVFFIASFIIFGFGLSGLTDVAHHSGYMGPHSAH